MQRLQRENSIAFNPLDLMMPEDLRVAKETVAEASQILSARDPKFCRGKTKMTEEADSKKEAKPQGKASSA